MLYLYVCLRTTCTSSAHKGQRVLDILKVELQIIVSEMLSRFWEPNTGSLKDQTEILNAEQSL